MSKNKKFKDWYDNEWGRSDEDARTDGKRYNHKKESVKFQREQKNREKNSFFDQQKD